MRVSHCSKVELTTPPKHPCCYLPLEPEFFLSNSFRAAEVVDDLNTCMVRVVPNENFRDITHDELETYKGTKVGLFLYLYAFAREKLYN